MFIDRLRKEMKQVIRLIDDALAVGNDDVAKVNFGRLSMIQDLLNELENQTDFEEVEVLL
jgi:hypothetical protein